MAFGWVQTQVSRNRLLKASINPLSSVGLSNAEQEPAAQPENLLFPSRFTHVSIRNESVAKSVARTPKITAKLDNEFVRVRCVISRREKKLPTARRWLIKRRVIAHAECGRIFRCVARRAQPTKRQRMALWRKEKHTLHTFAVHGLWISRCLPRHQTAAGVI